MRRSTGFGRRASIGLLAAAAATHAMAGQSMHLRGEAVFVLHGGLPLPGGHTSQGYLGVDLHDLSEEQASFLKMAANPAQSRGAEILHVDHDGPAGKAGLREHDIVLSINGQPVDGCELLKRTLRESAPGRMITLTISRDGQQQTISAQMANREDVERQAWEQQIALPEPQSVPQTLAGEDRPSHRSYGFFSVPGRAGRSAYTGATLETMAPQLAEFFGAQGRTGLLVRSVDQNSPAAIAGMHAGDVVVRANAVSIATSSDWMRAVHENRGKPISVVVLRDRREQVLTIIPSGKHHAGLVPGIWPRFGEAYSQPMHVQPVSQSEEVGTFPDSFTM